MAGDDVLVTGLGLVTPAGTDQEQVWRTLCAGHSRARRDPNLAGLPVDFSCQVTDFDPVTELGGRLARGLDPFVHFAVAAGRRAVTDAGLCPAEWTSERVGVVLGVGGNSVRHYPREFARLHDGAPKTVSPWALPRSLPNMAAGQLAIDLGARGINFVTGSACASGATALGVARDLVRSGVCDVVLAGGSESARSRMTATCFAQMRVLSRATDRPAEACRPFDAARDGFVLGEGAAVLVLESARHARARGARPRAALSGYGASADAYHHTAPHPSGRGAEQAVVAALKDSGRAPGDIGHVNAHGTATVLNDAIEAGVLCRTFASPPPVTATKSVIGHALGAAGAIEAAVTVLALERQTVPPTANFRVADGECALDVVAGQPRPVAMTAALATSFGFGGQNAALVLTTP